MTAIATITVTDADDATTTTTTLPLGEDVICYRNDEALPPVRGTITAIHTHHATKYEITYPAGHGRSVRIADEADVVTLDSYRVTWHVFDHHGVLRADFISATAAAAAATRMRATDPACGATVTQGGPLA